MTKLTKAEEVAKELAKQGIDPSAAVPSGIPEPTQALKHVKVPIEYTDPKTEKKININVVWN